MTSGFFKLFRGIAPSVLGSFPGQAAYYTTYEVSSHKIKECLPSDWQDESDPLSGFVIHSIAGGIAEIAGGTFYIPADIISQRLQVQGLESSRRYSGASDIIKSTFRLEGVKGFYRGAKAYVMAYAPGSAIYWGSYETFKKLWFDVFRWTSQRGLVTGDLSPTDSETARASQAQPQRATPSTLTGYVHALSGACAALCSCVANNPFDMMRTRIQLLEPGRDDRDFAILRKGYWQYFTSVVREEGFRALYRGLRPRLFVAIPGSVLALSGYEAIKAWSYAAGAADEEDSIINLEEDPPPLHRIAG